MPSSPLMSLSCSFLLSVMGMIEATPQGHCDGLVSLPGGGLGHSVPGDQLQGQRF